MSLGRFRNRMASGVVALIPIVITVLVVRILFGFTAGILLPVVDPIVDALAPAGEAGRWETWLTPVLSVGILLVVVYLLGTLATNIIGRRVLALGEAVVLRVPFVKVVYSATKQVVAAFQSRKSGAFKSVVFLEFPRPGMRAVGFVTSSMKQGGATWNSVFVPTTPNPTTGFLQLVPASDLVSTDMTVEEGVKLVMSLGVLVPDRVRQLG